MKAVVLLLASLLLTSGCTDSPETASSDAAATSSLARPGSHPTSVRVQLQDDPIVRNAMLLGAPVAGSFRCEMTVLGRDRVGHRIYVWLSCGDCRDATLASGSSLPARVTVTATGRGPLVTGVEFPRDSAVDADVRALFPPPIAARIEARDVGDADGSCA